MDQVQRVAEIRAAEQAAMTALEAAGRDRGLLMQLAAEAIAERARGFDPHRVLLLVGPGDNGGDGLFAAQRLASAGIAVDLLGLSERHHEEGWTAAIAAGATPVERAGLSLTDHDLVIDAFLGIGARPGLSDAAAAIADQIHAAGIDVLAVDLPSGLAADSGAIEGSHVVARETITFGALKPVHVLEPAAAACGAVTLVGLPIDLDPSTALLHCWTAADLAAAIGVPGPGDDKYSRGVVGLDTGSDTYPGAGILGAIAASHAGAGMVRVLGAEQVRIEAVRAMPNVVTADGRVQTLVLGSGWGERGTAEQTLAAAVERLDEHEDCRLVIDADALAHWRPGSATADRVLLTPHAGELARMLGCERAEITADPVAAAHRGASDLQATVLLKGGVQFVAGPEAGPLLVPLRGPGWTGQAGSGDVLAGICGAMLAGGLPIAAAAAAAASLQALTAARLAGPYPPQRIAVEVAATIATLTGSDPSSR